MTESTQATPSTPALTDRSLLRSAWWMTGSNLVAQSLTYGSLIVLARWLSPNSFGTVAVATAIVGVGVLFVDQGTWGAVIVEPELSRADLTRALWRCLLTGVVLAVAMAAAASTVVDRFAAGGDAAAVAVIAICLPLHAVAVVPTALLQRSMQFGLLAGLTAVANVTSALVAVLVALDGLGLWALVARQLVLYGTLAVLSSVLCLPALRAHVPRSGHARRRHGQRIERWFFLFTVSHSVTSSLDKLIIGVFSNAGLVGMYSIAITIAMAPWTQFSAQVGKVLFAAAASQPESCSERTEQSVKLMSMLMLPLLPVGILIAPTVLPGVLGPEWQPMVPVFQVLLVVGIGNAVINCIAEPLTGKGYMPFRAKVMVAQCVATVTALGILVPIGGILGAALAQLLVFLPCATVFFTAGARRADTSTEALWRSLRPVAVAFVVQLAVSSAVLIGLLASGATDSVSACVAAVAGLLAVGPVLWRTLGRIRS